MKEEVYLKIAGAMSRKYLPFCPFEIPVTNNIQNIVLIGMIFKEVQGLQEVLDVAGEKMNEHALEAFRIEIARNYRNIVRFKANIES